MKTQATQSFPSTCWELVWIAANGKEAEAKEALGELCDLYRKPICAFIRRRGWSYHDAEDLTADFFARLREKEILANTDESKGKLRGFLLACVRNYMANEYSRALAQKRGAGLVSSLDAIEAEKRQAIEPRDELSPDHLYQRQWTVALLDRTLRLVEAKYIAEKKGQRFTELRPFLDGDKENAYQTLSSELNVSVATLRTRVCRLRDRWRVVLWEQVAATLDNPTTEQIRAEISELMSYCEGFN